MPKKVDVENVKEILNGGNFDGLVGAVENERLECKAAPYQVDLDHEKLELAKDVSALANGDGGVILLGVETEKDPRHFGDEIKKVHPFPRGLVNPEQYQAILGSWIYPTLEQVEVQWFPAAGTPDKGLVAILVPKQPGARYPFLLTKTIDDKGKLGQVVFGYVERRRANAVPMSVQELHALVRDGLHFDSLNNQLETLRVVLERQTAQEGQRTLPAPEDLITARVEQALTEVRLYDKPVFVLSSVPTPAVQIPTLFERRDAPIVSLVEQPPKLREAGFDLESGSSARIVEGRLRRAMTPGYKLLEVWRDGTLIFLAPGDHEFLGWGKHAQEGRPIRINQLALIEATYLFVELSRRVYEEAQPRPEAVIYSLEIRNMTVNEVPCGLIPGPLGTFASEFGTDIRAAPTPRKRIAIRWEKPEIVPGLLALLLVQELYAWFGIEHDRIPYSKQVGDHKEIDPEQIQNAGKR